MKMIKLVNNHEAVWAHHMTNNVLYRKRGEGYYLVKRWCIDAEIREMFANGELFVKTMED